MADNKSQDVVSVFKDIWQTGTQELSKTMLSSSSSNTSWKSSPTPAWQGNQISLAQEKREKEVIERRKG